MARANSDRDEPIIQNDEDEAYSSSEDYGEVIEQDKEDEALAALQKAYPDEGHFANLIYQIDDSDLLRIGSELSQAIKDDDDSRSEWKKNLQEGINALGWQMANTTAKFKGASGVYSTAYVEGFLNLHSIITNELLRREGPCDTEIEGEANETLDDTASRVKDWMNYYLTKKYPDYYDEKDKCFMWAIIAGSSYSKTYIDPVSGRICSPHIEPEDVIVNSSATSLKTAKRITHEFSITFQELKLRQLNGFYREIELSNTNDDGGDENEVMDEQKRAIEGVDPEEDYNGTAKRDFKLYECHCQLMPYEYELSPVLQKGIEEKNLPVPFVVTLSRDGRVLRVTRNSEKDDTTYKPIIPFTKYTFLNGFWFQGYGLAHLALNPAKAATALLRQTIDSNTFSTFPGGFIHKDLNISQRDFSMNPGEFKPIDVPGENINNYIMALPFKEPNMISKDLMDSLENSIKSIIGAANLDLEQFNTNAPVGTVLAVLEQMNKHQSAIIRRFHKSFSEELMLIYKLFGKILPDQPYPFKVPGKNGKIMKSDFSDDIRIIPVSDPTVNSSALRMIRAQAVDNLASANPELFNLYEVKKLYLKELKIPDIDKIMPPPEKEETEKAVPLDPISENINAMNGEPLKAGMTQDHQAHMTVHGNWIQMQLQQNPEADMSVMQAHIHKHTIMQYQIQMEAMMGIKLPKDPNKLSMDKQNELAMQAAQTLMQQQQQQQASQQPPLTQEQVLMEQVKVDAQDSERRAQEAARKMDMQQMESDRKYELAMNKAEFDKLKLEVDLMKAEQKNEFEKLKLQINTELKDQQLKQQALKDLDVIEDRLEETQMPSNL